MTETVLLLLSLVGLALSCLTAIAARALRDFSRHELQQIVQKRGAAEEYYREILDRHADVALAMDNLRVILTSLVAAAGSLWIWFTWGLDGAGWWGLMAGGFAGALCLLAAAIWIPFAVTSLWAEAYIYRTWPLWRFASQLMAPLVWIAQLISAVIRRLSGRPPQNAEQQLENEIRTIVTEGHRDGLLQDEEREMLEGVMDLSEVQVSEIITPRTYMVCMPLNASWDEAVRIVIDSGHTRIPVYHKNRDDIVGVLYMKDLLPELAKRPGEPRRPLADLLRKPFFVPGTKPVNELLQEFQNSRNHIAVVLDEYGGVAGLVSIEDALEEIVGEIADEYDDDLASGIKIIGDNKCEALARVRLEELNERLGLALPEDADYDTLGGFLFHELGRIPAVGEEIVWRDVRFRILDATRRRIDRVAIEVVGRDQPSQAMSGA